VLSRHLRLLRDHGVIRKLPRQNKYQLTEKGRKLTTLISVLLGASSEQLLQMAA
jgi:DNA-binding HxlR family transcriptional regulator